MTSKDSFNGRNSMVRTKSLFTDSFKMGASLLQGMTSSNKSIKHLTLDSIYKINNRHKIDIKIILIKINMQYMFRRF